MAGRDSFFLLQIIAAAKKRGQEKAKLTKSLIVLDVKPWDDTTGEQRPCRGSSAQSHTCRSPHDLNLRLQLLCSSCLPRPEWALGCVCCTPAACPPTPNSLFVPPGSTCGPPPCQSLVTLLLQICRVSCCVLLLCKTKESATSSSVKCWSRHPLCLMLQT